MTNGGTTRSAATNHLGSGLSKTRGPWVGEEGGARRPAGGESTAGSGSGSGSNEKTASMERVYRRR